jgi:hypothetical protein
MTVTCASFLPSLEGFSPFANQTRIFVRSLQMMWRDALSYWSFVRFYKPNTFRVVNRMNTQNTRSFAELVQEFQGIVGDAAQPFVQLASQIAKEMLAFDGVLDDRQLNIVHEQILQPMNQVFELLSAQNESDLQQVEQILNLLQSKDKLVAELLQLTPEQQGQIVAQASAALAATVTDMFAEAFKLPTAALWDGISSPPDVNAVEQWLTENTIWGPFLTRKPNSYMRDESFQGYIDAGIKPVRTPIIEYWNARWEDAIAAHGPEALAQFAAMRDAEDFATLWQLYEGAREAMEDGNSAQELAGYGGNLIDETYASALYALADPALITDDNMRALVRFHVETVKVATSSRIMGGFDRIYRHLADLNAPFVGGDFVQIVSTDDLIVRTVSSFTDYADQVTTDLMSVLSQHGLLTSTKTPGALKEIAQSRIKATQDAKIVWSGKNTFKQVSLLSARYHLALPGEELSEAEWLAQVVNAVLAEAKAQKTFSGVKQLLGTQILAENATDTALYSFLSNQITAFGAKAANTIYQAQLNTI